MEKKRESAIAHVRPNVEVKGYSRKFGVEIGDESLAKGKKKNQLSQKWIREQDHGGRKTPQLDERIGFSSVLIGGAGKRKGQNEHRA